MRVLIVPLPRLTPLLDAAPACTRSLFAPVLTIDLDDRGRGPLADLRDRDQRGDANDDPSVVNTDLKTLP